MRTLLAKEAEEKKMLEANEKQKALELKIQQKLEKEAEETESKINEARMEISMRKRKNMEIPSELYKTAELDERVSVSNLKIHLLEFSNQIPISLPTYHQTLQNQKRRILDTGFIPVHHFRESLVHQH